MGDLRAWSPEPNGTVLEEGPSSNPTAISDDYWQTAESATQWIIEQVRPTLVSEERRRAVIDYVQRLIWNSVGCQVFQFGSVPLKTYLPDGDIDLTAFGGMNVEEALANDVCCALEREDQNSTAEFVVKDVQLIRAEVKLVKCLVQNIVVDISFKQLGGLCTLCFLEEVDRLIGKDHLFKLSIILIKAWCYYESRILGAHHGLISTYALETLVLYIFHHFHSSLNGPLAVLYKFLDYFSKFDWDNYCISLNGPVRISSLPEVVVEAPENGGGDLLLSNDFLKECMEMFSVPARGSETNSRAFPPKHLNIVDPLKENNNLGRSVSKGNFYRIRSAFTYGARKLRRVLSQPEENVADELRKFFANTLDRHESGQRPDVQDPIPMDEQCTISSFLGRVSCQEDRTSRGSASGHSGGITGEFRLDNEQSFHGVNNVKVPGRKMSFGKIANKPKNSANGTAVSENRVSGDAKDLATFGTQGRLIPNDVAKSSSPNLEESQSPVGRAHHAPHLSFSNAFGRNGEMRNGNPEWKQPESSGFTEKRVSPTALPASAEEISYVVRGELDDNQVISNRDVLSPVGSTNHPSFFSSVTCSSEDLYPSHLGSQALGSNSGSPKVFNCLPDLSGDIESHRNSLLCAQWWYEHGFNGHVPSMSPPLPTQFQSKDSSDIVRWSSQFRRNVGSQTNVNGVIPRPMFYSSMNPPVLPGAAFGVEEMHKPQGTGTYFPNTNHYKDRPLTGRGKNHTPMRSPRNNGRIATTPETNWSKNNSRELSQAQFHFHQGSGKFGSSDLHHSGFPETKLYSNVNGPMHLPERIVEFGSIGHLPLGVPTVENVSQLNPGSAPTQNSVGSPLMPEMQRSKTVLSLDQDRIAVKSYHLKDEDDFPPLLNSSGKGSSIYMVKKLERAEQ